ncbi:MAG: hypothetical protein V9E83_13035 [Baekduia sp.]
MLTTLAACALTLLVSLVAGWVVLASVRWDGTFWIAAPVGLAAWICGMSIALHVPGRSFTTGLAGLGALAVAAVLVGHTRGRPSWLGWRELVVLVPPLVLGLVPFLVYGRTGILGVSVNNDTASHLQMSDAFRYAGVFDAQGLAESYPVGPHAFVAALGSVMGAGTGEVFTGFTLATFVMAATAGVAFVRSDRVIARVVVAGVAGAPYLVVGYFVQGSFKETAMVALILAAGALFLSGGDERRGRARWLPLAVLLAGMVATYSYNGVIWTVPAVGLWLGIEAVRAQRAGGLWARLPELARAHAVPLGTAAAAGAFLLVPQAPRVIGYLRDTGGGTNIEGSPLGNLAAALPVWESLGFWRTGDYRYVPADVLASGAGAGVLAVLAIAGAVWIARRGDWILPIMAGCALAVWWYLDRFQTPYLAAKGLAMAAPPLALLIVVPFVDSGGWIALTRGRYRGGVIVVGVFVAWLIVGSSMLALRSSKVGPLEPYRQLRALADRTDNTGLVFLGNTDFLRWAIPEARSRAPFIAFQDIGTRAEKSVDYGKAFDIDSIPTEVLNESRWLISPRDPAASRLPRQYRRVAVTPSFALYRRVGKVPERVLLIEGQDAYGVLDCRSPRGRRLLRRQLRASVRAPQSAVTFAAVLPGTTAHGKLRLAPGRWAIAAQYTSGHEAVIRVGRSVATVPANLDRPGTRYRAGALTVRRTGDMPVSVTVGGGGFARLSEPFYATVIAVPQRAERIVPIRRACGRPVDYLIR